MVKFDYSLDRHGWAMVKLHWDGGSAAFDASYISDPLEELASQARWMVDPVFRSVTEFRSTVRFLDEPGEAILLVTWSDVATELEKRDRITNLLIRKLVVCLKGADGLELDESFETTAEEYASAVFDSLLTLWEQYGVTSYRERWVEYDFPVAHFAAIGKYLKRKLPERRIW